MINSELNSSTKILETTLSGLITIPEVKRHYTSIIYNKALPSRLKIIINSKDATYQFERADLIRIADSVKELLDHFDIVVEAIIESNPYETALAFMYEKRTKLPNFNFKVFSTREAAMTWLSTF
ncbi:MAG: hypothetical protein K8S16_21055 [Bacteroidales bacterium]|nr:hypothetical protein [Bacteroidales bacterium]